MAEEVIARLLVEVSVPEEYQNEARDLVLIDYDLDFMFEGLEIALDSDGIPNAEVQVSNLEEGVNNF